MNFDYSETQRMLVDSAEKRVKARAGVEHWRARRDLADGLDAAAWSQFADLGWLALPIAEEAGGLGGGMDDVALLMVALGKGLAVEPYVSTAILGAHILARGAQSHRDRLAQIAAGELRLALAHSEAADRYDAADRKTIATRTKTGFALKGVKLLAYDAPCAHQLIVTAAIEGARGTALFLVDPRADGVTLSPYPMIDGARAADVQLDGVKLDGSALIADGEAGGAILAEAIDRATVALLAQAVGSMEQVLEICSAYLKERKQFGQPIGSFQALQHLMVDMLVAAHQARSTLYHALANLEAAPARRAHAVSLAKVVGGEAMQLVSRTGIQLHGGYGVTDEYAVSHHFRRLLALEKQFGDIDHHVRRMARLRPDANDA